MAQYVYMQGDTAPAIAAVLEADTDGPIPPPDEVRIVICAEDDIGNPIVNAVAEIVDPTTMLVRWDPDSGFTATPGRYWLVWRCYYSGSGRWLSVPNDRYDDVVILPGLV